MIWIDLCRTDKTYSFFGFGHVELLIGIHDADSMIHNFRFRIIIYRIITIKE